MLGLALGTWIVLASPFREAPGWPAWAALAVALTIAAGAVFVYGLERWAELRELRVIRMRALLHLILGLVALAALLLAAQVPLTGGTGSRRAGALVAIMLLGGAPALGVMLAVRLAAGGDELSSTPGGQVADLIALRRLLQRLLPALGSLLASAAAAFLPRLTRRPPAT